MPEPSPSRDLRLDFFRGLSLVFIFIDHIPNNVLTYFTLQSIGFYDAAEVFIFISGYTAALVYGRRLATKGALYTTAQVLRRAWQLYVAHIFLFMLFVAEVSYTVAAFNNTMYNEEMRVADFLKEPHVAVIKALLLEFQPTFLDILPLYIVLLLIFPAVLLGARRHWLLVLVPSATVYFAVQIFHISVPAYPPGRSWFFNPLAWQFLFVIGALLGSRPPGSAVKIPLRRLVYLVALVVLVAGVVVRLSWTLSSVWDAIPPLLIKSVWPSNKSNLSLMRLVPFFALVMVVATHVRPNARFLGSGAARPLVLCGQQSLEIFCLGILLSALGHFILTEYNSSVVMQLAVSATGITTMCLIAWMIDWYKRMDRMPSPQPAAASRGGRAAG